jgi:hypothetical protein
MRKFTISAAAMAACAALLASAPAMAEYHFGPMQNGNQCWHGSAYGVVPGRVAGPSNGFGYWGACAQTASATTVAQTRRQVRRHHTASH